MAIPGGGKTANDVVRLLVLALGMALASGAHALKERSEEGFPLVFAEDRRDLGDQLKLGDEFEILFDVTNPTDETITYFLKSSSRRATVTHKHIEIAPGETQQIEVTVKNKIVGPFRYRIGVVVESHRSAVLIEGSVVE
jgi:hypothetical protein